MTYDSFFISNGEVDVFKKEELVATLGSGDYFGEVALFNDFALRNATISAKSVVQHYALGRENFSEAMKLFPEFENQIKQSVKNRNPIQSTN